MAKKLPADYTIEAGGTIEESAKGLNSIVAVFPLMIMLMLIILMVQLQSFQKMILVISVAPLGLIGVVAALLPTGTPMGFVAILGIIALSGMIIRNSVILVDQIDMDMARGLHPWDAVIDATTNRFRPIVLTAAAASLGMIPIASEVFWGPMAYAIIGGLIVATLLTLLFLPALYVAWFRIKEPSKGAVGERHRAGAGSRPDLIFAIGGFVGSGEHIRKQAPMIRRRLINHLLRRRDARALGYVILGGNDGKRAVRQRAGIDRCVLAGCQLPVGRPDLSLRQPAAQADPDKGTHQAAAAGPLGNDPGSEFHLCPPEPS